MAAWLFENGANPAALCHGHSAYAFAAVFSYADLVARPDALGQTTPLTDMEQMLAQAAKGRGCDEYHRYRQAAHALPRHLARNIAFSG